MQQASYDRPGHKGIPLHRKDGSISAVAYVDEGDYERVARLAWSLTPSGYVRARLPGGNGKQVRMHRFVMGVTDPSVYVDHRNFDRLDNTRANLRLGDHRLNSQNRRPINKTSPYRGVCWDKHRQQWKATVGLGYRTYNLGRFATEEEAARAAALFRAEHMPFSEDAA